MTFIVFSELDEFLTEVRCTFGLELDNPEIHAMVFLGVVPSENPGIGYLFCEATVCDYKVAIIFRDSFGLVFDGQDMSKTKEYQKAKLTHASAEEQLRQFGFRVALGRCVSNWPQQGK